MDSEEFTAQLQELEKLASLVDIPLDRTMGSHSDHEQLIEYLVTDSMNIRRYAARLTKLARSFSTKLENLSIKCKNLRSQNDQLSQKLEIYSRKLDQSEKNLTDKEEQVEYLTGIVEEREKSLKIMVKDNEKVRNDLKQMQKEFKEREKLEVNQLKNEKLSISLIKEENSKKVTEIYSELMKKMKMIEDLTKTIKMLESNFFSEKNNNELLRNQVGNLKHDLFTLNSKVSDLKTKNFSLKEKIKDLEENLDESRRDKEEISKKMQEMKEKEKCFEEIETSDHTLEANFKKNNGKNDNFGDFFVTDQIGELEESSSDSENFVFFIQSPKILKNKFFSFDFESGEGINIVSPKVSVNKRFIFEKSLNIPATEISSTSEIKKDIPSPDHLSKSMKIFNHSTQDEKEEVLKYKDPVKNYFLKLVQEIKSQSPFPDSIKKIPTSHLYSTLQSSGISMCYWPEEIKKYLQSKLSTLI
jgi:hypothetical protein